MEIKKVKKIKNYSKITNFDQIQNFLNCYGAEHALFLDIETTGFSRAKAYVYLIGCAYLQGQYLVTEQFFADSQDTAAGGCTNQNSQTNHLEQERALLSELSAFCSRVLFDTVITFHGLAFDLPFLNSLCARFGLDPLFQPDYDNKNYVDLYAIYSVYRPVFQLPDLKQKTLEAFLGMNREDAYDSGALIKEYQEYVKNPTDRAEYLFLRHNREDLRGMAALLDLHAYTCFFNGGFQITDTAVSAYRKMDGSTGKELTISCLLTHPLPSAVSSIRPPFYLHAKKTKAMFRIPVYEGTLKYFYPNYKEYYYLPQEDMAIHKSVAAYVDRTHRQKATPANCYGKKTGLFLPQLQQVAAPAFFEAYQDAVSYFELPRQDETARGVYDGYCMHILQAMRDEKS